MENSHNYRDAQLLEPIACGYYGPHLGEWEVDLEGRPGICPEVNLLNGVCLNSYTSERSYSYW